MGHSQLTDQRTGTSQLGGLKNKERQNWATRGGYIAPIIIPSTPDSELLKIMREVGQSEAEPGLRFRIEERGRVTIKKKLRRSNPTAKSGCAE